jgi:hypothetical protein
LDLRRSVLTRYMNRAGRPLHRTGLGSPQASLFHTRPLFLNFHDLPLSFICLYCWRNVLACLIPIQTWVSDRSHLVSFDATILFRNAGPRPENNKDTPGESNRRPPHAKETSPNITPTPPRRRNRVISCVCGTELSICTVKKRTFQSIDSFSAARWRCSETIVLARFTGLFCVRNVAL